jgi:hypothetical protein
MLAVVSLVVVGCAGKPHLIDEYGTSYHAAFAVQADARPLGPAQAAAGLDSQDAAIITQTYRASLAPQEAKPKDQPILIVTPPSPQGPAQKLAPSVPQER